MWGPPSEFHSQRHRGSQPEGCRGRRNRPLTLASTGSFGRSPGSQGPVSPCAAVDMRWTGAPGPFLGSGAPRTDVLRLKPLLCPPATSSTGFCAMRHGR